MSFQAMAETIKIKNVSIAQKLLLLCIANYTNEDGEAWPSQKRLADDACMTREAVNRNLTDLVKLGLISREFRARPNGSQTTSTITLLYCLPSVIHNHTCDLKSHPPVIHNHIPCDLKSHPEPITEPVSKNQDIGPPPKSKRIIGTHFQNAGIDSLSADWENIGYSKGLTREFIHDQFERFANYWTSQPNDRKARKSDWTATWRNWLGKSAEMANRPGRAKTSSAADGGWLDAAAQLRDFL